MFFLKKSPKYPLPFLFYIEWLLLILIIIDELFIFPHPRPWWVKLISITCVMIFGVIGVYLPTEKSQRHKLIYILAGFLLLLISTGIGMLNLLPLFIIVIFTRACLIFPRTPILILPLICTILLISIETLRWGIAPISPPPPPLPLNQPPAFMAPGATNLPPPPFPPNTIAPPFPRPPDDKLDQDALFHPPHHDNQRIAWFGRLILFAILLFIQILLKALLSEQQSRQELAIAHQQLREYAAKIEDIVTLEERNRIAREIHDSLGHYLTVLNINLEAAWKLLGREPEEAKNFLAEAKQQGSQALKEVRQSVSALRQNPLQNANLNESINLLIAEFYKTTNILPRQKINISPYLSNEVKIAVYRVIQESLTNIYKYANATDIEILVYQEIDSLYLKIVDNGNGFNLAENTTGFGLQSMQERILALGGTLQIVTEPQQGCKILVKIPLSPRADHYNSGFLS
ncbi:MAG: sensor histidine kinase [Microcoleaceae cyanobacterium]